MILRHLLAYAVAALAFMGLDAIWLTTMTPALYRPALAHLVADRVDVASALAFYAVYLVGVVAFAVEAARTSTGILRALGRGALFGLVAYATYDLTNQATLRDWPWHLTVIDLCWGGVNSGVSSFVAAALTLRLLRK